ncbi:MAG: SMC-Scp complex subunit ScpB [Candidatus Acetothermia bacterium]
MKWGLGRSEKDQFRPQALLEAALFLSEDGLSYDEAGKLTGLSGRQLDELVEGLKNEFSEPLHGIRLEQGPNRLRLRVKERYLGQVEHLAPHQDLSRGVLRTLSVIAYNSPVLQKEVVEVRGNGAYSHIDELVERGFVRSEKEGRTKLLSVTDHFLNYFELDSLEELKQGA